jgi:hypothetical protein
MNHEKRHATERNPQPDKLGKEIAGKELAWTEDPSHETEAESNQTRAKGDSVTISYQLKQVFVHRESSNLLWSLGGRSAAEAC